MMFLLLKITEHEIFVFRPGKIYTQRLEVLDQFLFVIGPPQGIEEIIFKSKAGPP
jgi:hypothetical protein